MHIVTHKKGREIAASGRHAQSKTNIQTQLD